MATPYAGANSFPSTILCPDDGDSRQASGQNIPDQGLADRTTYLLANLSARADVLTTPSGGAWVCPPNVTSILVIAHGGGGGGGGGGGADNTTPGSRSALGGGGGGGSQRCVTRMAVTPGTSYAYAVGVGGLAGGFGIGMGGLLPSGGSDGGDSTFNAIVIGRGAGGGNAPIGPATTVSNLYASVAGGKSVRQGVLGQGIVSNSPTSYFPNTAATPSAGDGGNGGSTTALAPSRGGPSQYGYDGGITGTQGASGGGSIGGGPGGGGGAGPAGNGGPGSNGGAGSATNGSQPTTASGPPATGSGAGGGGGGGGGSGATNGANGCGGQSGGSGSIVVIYNSGVAAVIT